MKLYTFVFVSVSLLFFPLGVFAEEYVRVDPQVIEDMLPLGYRSELEPTGIGGLDVKGDYLYCTSPSVIGGVHAVDISDPTDMQFPGLGEVELGQKPQGVGHYENTLYVAGWSPGRGLHVLDITEPLFPELIYTINTGTENYTWTLELYDGLLLLELNNKAEGVARINIYDVATDPDNHPQFVTSVNPGVGGGINNASKYQDYMYFSCNGGVYVYDISTPSTPVFKRRIPFTNGTDPVDSHIGQDGNLYVLARSLGQPDRFPGLYSFSLTENGHGPSDPQQLDYVDIAITMEKHFYIHDETDTAYIVGGGGSIYTVDISNPSNMVRTRHWSVSWPESPYHDGYSAKVTGSGGYIYVGTAQASGYPEDCDDFDDDCEWYGARIYAIRVATMPPIIAEVTPDPDIAYVNHEYTKQLTLIQGDPPITWSVSNVPSGTTVDSSTGLVGDWVPSVGDLGQLRTLEIKATGYMSHEDYESWTVYVKYLSDFDDDHDVDQEDFGFFQACYSGAGVNYEQGCEEADLNGDNAVDQEDFDIFQGCLGGANNPPGC